MILVVGAAGPCGRAVTRAVQSRGGRVRAWVHRQDQADTLSTMGVSEVVVGELADVTDIDRAVTGVEGVFHLGPRYRPDETAIGQAMIRAAVRHGARRFVYLSALHPIASAMVHHDAKRRVEEELIATDLEFTILQSARFMQNLAFFWPRVLAEGVLAEPFSATSKMSVIDFVDVAEVAAIALTTGGLERASLPLCAAGELDRHDMAAILTRVTGRSIAASAIPLDDWTDAQSPGRPTSPYVRHAMAQMFAYYDAHGLRGGNAAIARAALGREPRTFAEFAAEFAARRPTPRHPTPEDK